MLTIEQIRKALQDRRPSVVAAQTGVSRQTIWRLLSDGGEPTYGNLKALSDYLERPL